MCGPEPEGFLSSVEMTGTAAEADRKAGTLGSRDEVEKEHILKVLRHTGGNYGDTCKILGVSRPTLRKKIADYGLKDFLDSGD